MRWIKEDMFIEAEGCNGVLEDLGYLKEDDILFAAKKQEKREKLNTWLVSNVCPNCKQTKRCCECGGI